MSATPAPPPVIRRRPTPVTILALVQLLSSTGYLLSLAVIAGAELAVLEQFADRGGALADGTLASVSLAAGLAVLAVVGFTAAILLFRMRQLGWTLTMLLAGVSLATQVYLYVTAGTLTVYLMLIQVVIVLYLNQREVRVAFGIGVHKDASMVELDERG
jgi:uncharacterized membrane protein (DUF2068 family)